MIKKTKVLSIITALLMLVAVAGYMVVNGTATHAANTARHVKFHPRFADKPLHQLGGKQAAAVRRNAGSTIPTWSSSFSYGGQNYPYTMVGTNPASGSRTTTIPVDIIPLVFNFSDGTTLDGNTVVNNMAGSALFHNASFNTGTTQYMDAIQRGEFWKTVSASAPNYHVLLGTPTIKPTVTLNVPDADGSTQQVSGGTVGLVDINWFSSTADSLAAQNNAPTHLVIFAAVNIYEYQGDPSQCCIGGYHTAVQSGGNTYTYAYASYDAAGAVFNDIEALSHEIAEWGSDPFTNNATPNWYASNYGCSNDLEVGDPAVGTKFSIGSLHYQDEVYFSWFARQSPSIGYKGRYDYLGTLYHSPAAGC